LRVKHSYNNGTTFSHIINNASDATIYFRSDAKTINSDPIAIGKRYDDSNQGQAYGGEWDSIFIRKYIGNNPTSTPAAPEDKPAPAPAGGGAGKEYLVFGWQDADNYWIAGNWDGNGVIKQRNAGAWKDIKTVAGIYPDADTYYETKVIMTGAPGTPAAPTVYPGDWWDTSYKIRRKLLINNTNGALTGFQTKLKVFWYPDMKDDFGDIRFRTPDGTEVKYWIEKKIDKEYANVYVKVDLAASGDTDFWMYYGNSGASSESNGSDVMYLFDDFETDQGWVYSENDPTPIPEYPATDQKHSGSNSYKIWKNGAFNPGEYGQIVKTITVPNGATLDFSVWSRSKSSYDRIYQRVYLGTTKVMEHDTNDNDDTWLEFTNSSYVTTGTSLDVKIQFYCYSSTSSGYDYYSWWDDIVIKQYAASDPTVTFKELESPEEWLALDGGTWSSRKEYTIQNTSGSNHYDMQVKINVDHADCTGMNTNFDDLRFSVAGGYAAMPYWIERKTDGVDADVWIRVPQLLTTDTTIYAYYENSSAASDTSGGAVFNFFDDFDSNLTNGEKWNVLTGYNGVSSGEIRLEGGADKDNIETSDYKVSGSAIIHFSMRGESTSDMDAGLGIGPDWNFVDDTNVTEAVAIDYDRWWGNRTNCGTGRTNNTALHKYRIIINTSGNTSSFYDDTQIRSHSRSGYPSGKIYLGNDSDSTLRDIYYGYVFARDFISTTPNVINGPSQSESEFRSNKHVYLYVKNSDKKWTAVTDSLIEYTQGKFGLGADNTDAKFDFLTVWNNAACSGTDGIMTPQQISAFKVPFSQESQTANKIRYCIFDMNTLIGYSDIYNIDNKFFNTTPNSPIWYAHGTDNVSKYHQADGGPGSGNVIIDRFPILDWTFSDNDFGQWQGDYGIRIGGGTGTVLPDVHSERSSHRIGVNDSIYPTGLVRGQYHIWEVRHTDRLEFGPWGGEWDFYLDQEPGSPLATDPDLDKSLWTNFLPAGVVNSATPTATIEVQDVDDGLDPSTVVYQFTKDNKTTWLPADIEFNGDLTKYPTIYQDGTWNEGTNFFDPDTGMTVENISLTQETDTARLKIFDINPGLEYTIFMKARGDGGSNNFYTSFGYQDSDHYWIAGWRGNQNKWQIAEYNTAYTIKAQIPDATFTTEAYYDIKVKVSVANNDWWNDAWKKRMTIEAKNTSTFNFTDYTCKVDLPKKTGMKADFSDVRFVDAITGEKLVYCKMTPEAGVTTGLFWIKITSLNATTKKKFHVYYDNALANTESDGTSVFPFYDDFYNTDKWDFGNSKGNWSVFNNKLKLVKDTSGVVNFIYPKSFDPTSIRYKVYSKMSADTGSNFYTILKSNTDRKQFVACGVDRNTNMWYFKHLDGSNNTVTDKANGNDGSDITTSPVISYVTSDDGFHEIFHNNDVTSKASYNSKLDGFSAYIDRVGIASIDSDIQCEWIFYRKWSTTEATVTIGDDDMLDTTITLYVQDKDSRKWNEKISHTTTSTAPLKIGKVGLRNFDSTVYFDKLKVYKNGKTNAINASMSVEKLVADKIPLYNNSLTDNFIRFEVADTLTCYGRSKEYTIETDYYTWTNLVPAVATKWIEPDVTVDFQNQGDAIDLYNIFYQFRRSGDTFTSPANEVFDDTSNWVASEPGCFTPEGGILKAEGPNGGDKKFLKYLKSTHGNQMITFRFRHLQDNGNDKLRFIFNTSWNMLQESSYEFMMDFDGSWIKIRKNMASPWPTKTFSFTDNVWYNVKVLYKDGNIKFFIDDKLISEVMDTSDINSQGYFQIAVEETKVEIDDLNIYNYCKAERISGDPNKAKIVAERVPFSANAAGHKIKYIAHDTSGLRIESKMFDIEIQDDSQVPGTDPTDSWQNFITSGDPPKNTSVEVKDSDSGLFRLSAGFMFDNDYDSSLQYNVTWEPYNDRYQIKKADYIATDFSNDWDNIGSLSFNYLATTVSGKEYNYHVTTDTAKPNSILSNKVTTLPDNYIAEFDLYNGADNGAAGLAFNLDADGKNYYLFIMGKDTAADEHKKYIRLIKVTSAASPSMTLWPPYPAGADECIVASHLFEYAKDTWYNIEIINQNGDIRIFIDGKQRIKYIDPNPIKNNTFALYNYSDQATQNIYFNSVNIFSLNTGVTGADGSFSHETISGNNLNIVNESFEKYKIFYRISDNHGNTGYSQFYRIPYNIDNLAPIVENVTPTAINDLTPDVYIEFQDWDTGGLNAEHFTWTTAPDYFETSVEKLMVDDINKNWGSSSPGGLPNDKFAIRYTGKLKTKNQTGVYQFRINSNDGVKVWIDKQLIIDEWTDGTHLNVTGSLTLEADTYVDLKIEFYENTGNADIALEWYAPSDADFTIIESLYYLYTGASGIAINECMWSFTVDGDAGIPGWSTWQVLSFEASVIDGTKDKVTVTVPDVPFNQESLFNGQRIRNQIRFKLRDKNSNEIITKAYPIDCDITSPVILDAKKLSPYTIEVYYSEPLQNGAFSKENFILSNGLSIESIAISGDTVEVIVIQPMSFYDYPDVQYYENRVTRVNLGSTIGTGPDAAENMWLKDQEYTGEAEYGWLSKETSLSFGGAIDNTLDDFIYQSAILGKLGFKYKFNIRKDGKYQFKLLFAEIEFNDGALHRSFDLNLSYSGANPELPLLFNPGPAANTAFTNEIISNSFDHYLNNTLTLEFNNCTLEKPLINGIELVSMNTQVRDPAGNYPIDKLIETNKPPVIGVIPLFQTEIDLKRRIDLTAYESDDIFTVETDLDWSWDFWGLPVIDITLSDLDQDIFTIEPHATNTGITTAIVRLTDAGGKWSTAEVTIQVILKEPPYFENLPARFTTEEDTPITLNFSAYENDVKDIQVLERPSLVDWTLTPSDVDIFTIQTINIDLDEFKFNPVLNQYGLRIVSVLLTDSDGLTAETTFSFEVISVPDAPVILSALTDELILDEDYSLTKLLDDFEFDVDPVDTDDNLKWTLSTYDTSICTMEVISSPSTADTLIIHGKKNAYGSEDIKLILTDSYGLTAEHNMRITIRAVNDDPLISPAVPANQFLFIKDGIPESKILFFAGNKFDVDDNQSDLTWSFWHTSPTPGRSVKYVILGDSITLIPTANAAGMGTENLTLLLNDLYSDDNQTDTFEDGQGSQVFQVQVRCYPWIVDLLSNPIPDISELEDFGSLTIELTAYEYDLDTPTELLVWNIVNSNSAVYTTNYVEVGATKYLVVDSIDNKFGTGTITVTLTDASGYEDTQIINVTVTSVNDLPVISPPITKENDRSNLVKPINAAPWDFFIHTRKSDVEDPDSSLTWTLTPSGVGPHGPFSAVEVFNGLPTVWNKQDIGDIGATGSFDESGGTYTVNGSGADIWGTEDAFHYGYHELTGDGEIIARVVSMTDNNSWAKAGVMMRESLDKGSRHAFMCISYSNGASFQRRSSIGGDSSNTTTPGYSCPYWVKLVRNGTTFTGYRSVDGLNWTSVGADTINMASTIKIGLAVTSHEKGTIQTSVFDNVSDTATTGDKISFTPLPDIRGKFVFSIELKDLNGGTCTNTFEAVVGGKPEISKTIPDITIDEDNMSTPTTTPIFFPLDLATYEENADGTSIDDMYPNVPSIDMNWSCAIGNPNMIEYVVYDEANDILRFTPIANAQGTCVLTLTVTDTDGGTDSRAITLQMDPVNDNPDILDHASTPKTLVYVNGSFKPWVLDGNDPGAKIPNIVLHEGFISVVYDLDQHEFDIDNPVNGHASWSVSPDLYFKPLTWDYSTSAGPIGISPVGAGDDNIVFSELGGNGAQLLSIELSDGVGLKDSDLFSVTLNDVPDINLHMTSAIIKSSELTVNEDAADWTFNLGRFENDPTNIWATAIPYVCDADSYDSNTNLVWNYNAREVKYFEPTIAYFKPVGGGSTTDVIFNYSIIKGFGANLYSVLKLEPVPNEFGEGDIHLTLLDSYGATDEVTIRVTINEINDKPMINPTLPDDSMTLQMPEDNSLEPTLNPKPFTFELSTYGYDVDILKNVPGENLKWFIVDSINDPLGFYTVYTDLFTFEISGSLLTIHPLPNKSGNVNVKFILEDAGRDGINQERADQEVTVTITPVNDPPEIRPLVPNIVCDEDDPPFDIDFSIYENDVEVTNGQGSTQDLIWRMNKVDTSIINWSVENDTADVLRFTPVANQFGSFLAEIILYDGPVASASTLSFTQEILITVNEINDPPFVEPPLPNKVMKESEYQEDDPTNPGPNPDPAYILPLWKYENDIDNDHSEMEWSMIAADDTVMSWDFVLNGISNELHIRPLDVDQNTTITVFLKLNDKPHFPLPSQNASPNPSFTLTILPDNDAPVIAYDDDPDADLPLVSMLQGEIKPNAMNIDVYNKDSNFVPGFEPPQTELIGSVLILYDSDNGRATSAITQLEGLLFENRVSYNVMSDDEFDDNEDIYGISAILIPNVTFDWTTT
ncbi:DUF2341 domain-containing protein, partial [bacterium]|nr:DUF2341 domain-containing protein [bacterium]